MTYGHLWADCLYTRINSGPSARYWVWEAFTFAFLSLVMNCHSDLSYLLTSASQFSPVLLWSLHRLLVRERITHIMALITHKVVVTATLVFLGDVVQAHVPNWLLHSVFRLMPVWLNLNSFYGSLHLELFTHWHSTVAQHTYIEQNLANFLFIFALFICILTSESVSLYPVMLTWGV